MNESEFHCLGDEALAVWAEKLEYADGRGALEVEMTDVGLLILLPDARQWLISKHTPSRQLWLSSPISGGLHFTYIEGKWLLRDGRELWETLAAEIF